ncbi:hypothetical protein OSB04_006654 [Centaurea solstitialis]|uniref:CCHC-type domain-containing protein n=1 Tax=Centaurea solstitialis TaxID=347529 RepID=A0AA38TID2_9ASTR|nr:hypothetical protein OSB04_006654 [Centaurea solstitialis]
MVKDGGVKKKYGHENTSKGKGQVMATLSAPRVYDNGNNKGNDKKVKPKRVMTENQYFKCHEVGHWRHNCPKHHEAGGHKSEVPRLQGSACKFTFRYYQDNFKLL